MAAERRLVTTQSDAGLVALFCPANQPAGLATDEDVVFDFFMSESAGDAISFANDDTSAAKRRSRRVLHAYLAGSRPCCRFGFQHAESGPDAWTAVAEPASKKKLATVTTT